MFANGLQLNPIVLPQELRPDVIDRNTYKNILTRILFENEKTGDLDKIVPRQKRLDAVFTELTEQCGHKGKRSNPTAPPANWKESAGQWRWQVKEHYRLGEGDFEGKIFKRREPVPLVSAEDSYNAILDAHIDQYGNHIGRDATYKKLKRKQSLLKRLVTVFVFECPHEVCQKRKLYGNKGNTEGIDNAASETAGNHSTTTEPQLPSAAHNEGGSSTPASNKRRRINSRHQPIPHGVSIMNGQASVPAHFQQLTGSALPSPEYETLLDFAFRDELGPQSTNSNDREFNTILSNPHTSQLSDFDNNRLANHRTHPVAAPPLPPSQPVMISTPIGSRTEADLWQLREQATARQMNGEIDPEMINDCWILAREDNNVPSLHILYWNADGLQTWSFHFPQSGLISQPELQFYPQQQPEVGIPPFEFPPQISSTMMLDPEYRMSPPEEQQEYQLELDMNFWSELDMAMDKITADTLGRGPHQQQD